MINSNLHVPHLPMHHNQRQTALAAITLSSSLGAVALNMRNTSVSILGFCLSDVQKSVTKFLTIH